MGQYEDWKFFDIAEGSFFSHLNKEDEPFSTVVAVTEVSPNDVRSTDNKKKSDSIECDSHQRCIHTAKLHYSLELGGFFSNEVL